MLQRGSSWIGLLGGALALLTAATGLAQQDTTGPLVQRLSDFVQAQSGFSQQQRAEAQKILDLKDETRTGDALAVLYPDFARGLAAADSGNLAEAQSLLGSLAVDESNPFLAADATYFLARALMNGERYEEAVPMLERLNGPLAPWSAHQADASYFMATCLAGTLQKAEAIRAFTHFVENFPNASERLRVSAWRNLQELSGTGDQKMSEVTTRMEYSRRRLDITEIGEQTQTEQHQIVKMLAEMIDEQQKKECSSGSCKKPGAQKKPDQSAQKQNSPQKPSDSQQGGQSNVANGQYVEKQFDNGETSPWSRLRDRSRDAANAAMKEKLPPRYREIVERYNDAVNGNNGNSSDNR